MVKKLVNFRLNADVLRLLNSLALDYKDRTEALENAIRIAYDVKNNLSACKDNKTTPALQNEGVTK